MSIKLVRVIIFAALASTVLGAFTNKFKTSNSFLYPGCTSCCIGYTTTIPRECNNCGAGWYANTLPEPTSMVGPGPACWPCPLGYLWTGDSCSLCGQGAYGPTTAATSCVHCPSNMVSSAIGATNISTCQTCPLGYFPGSSQSVCTSCEGAIPGCTSCSNTSTIAQCLSCADGFYLYENICFACSSGSYLANVGDSSCTACPTGKYTTTSQQGFNECTSCPPGSTFSGAKTSIKYCGLPSCLETVGGKCIEANAPYFVLPGPLPCSSELSGCSTCAATGSTTVHPYTCLSCSLNTSIILQPVNPPVSTAILAVNPWICSSQNCTALNRATTSSSGPCGACLAGFATIPTTTGSGFICE